MPCCSRKPLGTGVISTAIKRGKAAEEWIEAATRSMTTLNRAAAEAALRYAVHGMTDVTGFGLIGHARELAMASNVALEIRAAEVPLLSGALECVQRRHDSRRTEGQSRLRRVRR